MLSNHLEMNSYLHWRSENITDLGNVVLTIRRCVFRTIHNSSCWLFCLTHTAGQISLRLGQKHPWHSESNHAYQLILIWISSLWPNIAWGFPVLPNLIPGLCKLQLLRRLAWTLNIFSFFSNYKLDQIYRCWAQESAIRIYFILHCNFGAAKLTKRRASFTKNVCIPWLLARLKYKYTEQIRHQVDAQEMLVVGFYT